MNKSYISKLLPIILLSFNLNAPPQKGGFTEVSISLGLGAPDE